MSNALKIEQCFQSLACLHKLDQAARDILSYLANAPAAELEALEHAMGRRMPRAELSEAITNFAETPAWVPLTESQSQQVRSLLLRGGGEIDTYLKEGDPEVDGYGEEDIERLQDLSRSAYPLSEIVYQAVDHRYNHKG